MVSSRLATLHELQTVYSTEDLYAFVEIITVDAHNARVMAKIREREQRR